MSHRRGYAGLIAVATFALIAVTAARAGAALEPQEQKCQGTIGKVAAKLAKTYLSGIAKCKDADISGKAPGACPDDKTTSKINKAAAKLESSISGTCASVCSVSNSVTCISNSTCPPLDNAPTYGEEQCSGVLGKVPFDIRNLGYPGPLCEAAVGGPLATGKDVATCVSTYTEGAAAQLLNAIYGSISSASTLPADAAKCLSSISKGAQTLSGTIYKGMNKCRSSIASGKMIGDPATCRYDDPKTADKIDKAQQKLLATMDNACTDAMILQLDLCNNGVGGTPDLATAKSCVTAAVNEVTDSTANPGVRVYAPVSLADAAYPPTRGVCGDGVVNQVPSQFAYLGEECDGADDAACPGQCVPPGDLYECTCASRPLIRYLANGFTADLDNGWTGTSHNSGVTDKAGYVAEVKNCDCSSLTDATCTGATSDSICDLEGFQLPTCSWDPKSATRCDAHGNHNGKDDDTDCGRCDAFTTSPGTFCANESQCTGQCYDANDVVQGSCETQADCGAGESCRGQCDRSGYCIIMTNGAPLPISSGGTAVCILTQFREDVFGTRNIVSGEHAVYIQQYSKVHLGVSNAVPCPVCGGFCTGGDQNGELCEGTCSATKTTGCRFDEDCPVGETCSTTSPDCPKGYCNLSLVCGGGANKDESSLSFGNPCRIEAYTKQFGTTSSDCLPKAGKNISGDGLEINFFPSTSEAVVLAKSCVGGSKAGKACVVAGDCPGGTCSSLACNSPGYELFDCPCPSGVGAQVRPTQPNSCAGACDAAGPQFGQGCATGAGNISGDFTKCDSGTCVGGANVGLPCNNASNGNSLECPGSTCSSANAGRACDADSDCPGSTCSDNPTHCTGGPPALEHAPCDTDADCGAGGTCVDACSSGRCVPLCLPGVQGDDEEGFCAGGPNFYRCSGENDSFRTCSSSQAAGSCSAVCAASCSAAGVPTGGSGTPCDGTTACPTGESCCGNCNKAQDCGAGTDGVYGTADDYPGAGVCIADIRNCFVNNGASEGGDIYNGKGDPTNVRTTSVFCISPTANGAVNQTSGLGGPGRLRQSGINAVNVTSIP